MRKLIVLYGPSASGKTSVEKELLRLYEGRCQNLLSLTTRKPREGEINGKDYLFCKDREEFFSHDPFARIQIGDDKNWLYGVNENSIKSVDDIGIISIISADYVDAVLAGALRFVYFEDIHLYFFTASNEVRENRLLKRGEDLERIRMRFDFEDKTSPQDFEARYGWLPHKKNYDTSENSLTAEEIAKEIIEFVD